MENNLTYTKNGDYLIPDLKLEETKPLGRYGRMRRDYLKEHRPVLFNAMMVSGKLYPHLNEIEQTMNRRLEQMMPELMQAAGVTEEFWAKLTPVVDFLLPQYRQEGRTELVMAVGCTGGRHRSVAVAHRLAAHIEALGYTVTESHRDMGR